MLKKFLFLPLLFAATLPLHSQTFHFQLFDVPGAASTEPDNINSRGDIVGLFFYHAGVEHGFLFSRGTFTQLDFPGAKGTKTAGLSDRGDIVGTFADAARPLLDTAIAAEPTNVEALALRVRVAFLQGQDQQAIADAQKVHDVPHSGYATVHYTAAAAFQRMTAFRRCSRSCNSFYKRTRKTN